MRYLFLFLRLGGPNRFSGHFQQDCLGTFPEIFWGDLILCSIQCRKPVGHLRCKLYCFLFFEFLEIQRRNAVLPLSFSQPDFERRLVTSGCNCLRAPEPFFRYFVFLPFSVSLSVYLPFAFFFCFSFLSSSSVSPSAFSHCISFLTISSAFFRIKRRKGQYASANWFWYSSYYSAESHAMYVASLCVGLCASACVCMFLLVITV